MGGDTATGGDTSTGGTGGTAMSLPPAQACPQDLELYSAADGDVLGGSPTGAFKHFELRGVTGSAHFFDAGTGADDRRGYSVTSGDNCIVVGDGDDIVEVEYESDSVSLTTISGGLGSDTFAFLFHGASPYDTEGHQFDIVDFEPGVDKLYFDISGFSNGFSQATNVVIVSSFEEEDAETVASARTIVVAQDSGSVWLATSSESGSALVIGYLSETEGLTEADIVLGATAPGCMRSRSEFADRRSMTGETVTDYFSAASGTAQNSRLNLLAYGGDTLKTNEDLAYYCIAGNTGDDTIQLFSDGSDSFLSLTISGGLGADNFVFDFPLNSEPSGSHYTVTIGDFTPGEDKFVLGASNFGLSGGTEDITIFATDINGGQVLPGPHVYFDLSDGDVWWSSGSVMVRIATLIGNPTVTAADVIVHTPET